MRKPARALQCEQRKRNCKSKNMRRYTNGFRPSHTLRGTAAIAIPILEHADERRELGIAYPACGIFDIKPGSPPLAFLPQRLSCVLTLRRKTPTSMRASLSSSRLTYR